MVLFPDFIDRYRFQVNNNLHLSFNPHEEISQLMKVLLLDRDLILLAGEFLFLSSHENKKNFDISISRIFLSISRIFLKVNISNFNTSTKTFIKIGGFWIDQRRKYYYGKFDRFPTKTH